MRAVIFRWPSFNQLTLFHLTHAEKVDSLDSVCVQYTTKYWLGRKHIYIPIRHIHDVVINEIIYGVSVRTRICNAIPMQSSTLFTVTPFNSGLTIITLLVSLILLQFRAIYMLQVLLKGSQSMKQPVLTLFSVIETFTFQ